MPPTPGLEDLEDNVLLIILEALRHADVAAVSASSRRLHAICEGAPELWRRLDLSVDAHAVPRQCASSLREERVAAAARKCAGAVSLSFRNRCGLDPALLRCAALAPLWGTILELDLHNCLRISTREVWDFCGRAPQLESVSLSGCHVGDEAVKMLARSCPRLTRLDVSRTYVSDSAMAALAAHCHLLEDLNIKWTGVLDIGVLLVARHCPGLRRLACGHGGPFAYSVFGPGFELLGPLLAALESLELLAHPASDQAPLVPPLSRALAGCLALRRLTLRGFHPATAAAVLEAAARLRPRPLPALPAPEAHELDEEDPCFFVQIAEMDPEGGRYSS
eukprot:tig00000189_g14344.t1